MEQLQVQCNDGIQKQQYITPYHWELRRIENYRYSKLTSFINGLIDSYCGQKEPKLLIVDFGCGDGRNTFELWHNLKDKANTAEIIGIDIDERAIKWAQERVSRKGVKGITFRIEKLHDVLKNISIHKKNNGSIFIIMRDVIEHLSDDKRDDVFRCIAETNRRMNVIITVPSVNSPVEPKHFRHYTANLLENVLNESGLKCDYISGFGFRPRSLYKILGSLKNILNRIPLFWRIMIPFWCRVSVNNCVTIVALAQNRSMLNQDTD